ncbi:hypothetical protein ACWGDS_43860 [Streptomyces sp. NPDC055059]|jgi:hypothetical protein|uniref:hypothetical protein n=1 Tax=Streptomyces sp. NPDC127172 TaxID=3345382 RepID=UPI00363EFACF
MALVKKGSRHITVDGIPYRWRIRRRPTYSQALVWSPLTYAVELADSPGSTLVVTTNQPHPSNWRIESASAVVPSAVADDIRTAQTNGWVPEKPGSPFHLDQSEGFASSPY